MIRRVMYLTVLILILISCRKVEFTGNLASVLGDYEWVYSKISGLEYILSNENSDKFGIRITEKSKVLFFQNGEQMEKYRIVTSSHEDTDTPQLNFIIDGDPNNNIYIKGDTLRLTRYPYSSRNNFFVKK